MNKLLLISMALICAAPLAAGDETVSYQLNGRGSLPGNTLKEMGYSRSGAGGGVAVLVGREAMRLRVRLDGDTYPGAGTADALNTYGLGADGVLALETDTDFRPTISAGIAFQKWKLGQQNTFNGKAGVNRAAARAEVGVQYRNRFSLYVGTLTGRVGWGRQARCPYVGFSVIVY